MDKFRALAYFVETAESGSFSLAAKYFDVPASSISRRVSDLESDLGAQLLTRSTRSVVLTEIGRQYLQQAKQILEQLNQSDQMVRSYQSQPTGVLKISALAGFGEKVLAPILDAFSQRYPQVTLDIVFSDQLSKLEKDDVDIAIRGGFAPDERVMAVRLMDNDFVVAVSPGYLAENSRPVAPEDLRGHQGLYYKTPVGPTPWLTQQDGQIQDVSGNRRLVTNNGQWLLQKALAGEGILMLPRWELQRYFDNGELIELKFEQPVNVIFSQDLAIFLLYQKLKYAIPKVKVAVDFITEKIRDQKPA